MLFSTAKGRTAMEHLDLGTLIVMGLCGIGLIQLIMWIAGLVRHPGLDDLRLDLSEATPTQLSKGDDAQHDALATDILREPEPQKNQGGL
jgi:hypothetical protein